MKLAAWLVRRLVRDPAWRESIAGDLEEEAAERQADGRSAGAWWALRAAVVTAWRVRRAEGAGMDTSSSSGLRAGLGFIGDLRLALRTLRRSPGFTVTALAVLSIGIGASAAIFAVVDATLLRPLPFAHADRLVAAGLAAKQGPTPFVGSITAPDYADWVAQQDVFDSIGASVSRRYTVRTGGRPEALWALDTTASLFDVLRTRPALGRLYTDANERAGNHRVAVISTELWQRRFGGDPHVIGQSIEFDEGSYEIIGVLPPAFGYPVGSALQIDVLTPFARLQLNDQSRSRGKNFTLRVVGRLKAGETVEHAQAELAGITDAIAAAHPGWLPATQTAIVRPLRDSVTGSARSWMLMVLGTVGVVLAIVCANVANLMLLRATTRARELSVRAALGASRWQLARVLLVESLTLSAGGLLGAFLVASWGISLLRTSIPASVTLLGDIAFDARVFAVMAGVAAATGVICGLAPVASLAGSRRRGLAGALSEGGRSQMPGRDGARLRSALVSLEVALAAILLVGAGLLVTSFARVSAIDLGFDIHNVMSVGVNPRIDVSRPASFDEARAQTPALMADVLARVRAIPGVEAAAAINGGTPLTGSYMRNAIIVPGQPKFESNDDQVDIKQVSPDYGAVIRAQLVSGRYLNAGDVAGAPAVVVINEEAAQRFFGGQNPLGTIVHIDEADRMVVGVVRSVRLLGPEGAIRPEAYVSFEQASTIGGSVMVRTASDPTRLAPAVRAAVEAALPGVPVSEPALLSTVLDGRLKQRRFNMVLVGLFGALAAVIASIGIYGVMAFVVAEQRREIGVRMALGAVPSAMTRMVLVRACVMLGAGVAVGGVAAWLAAGSMTPFLFSVRPHDPVVFVGVSILLAAMGVLAAFVPALRASRVDPIVVLRAE